VTLYKNTNCAIADLKELHKQTESVRNAAIAFNQSSAQEERRYGAACERPIRADSLTGAVFRPLTDCAKCCGGEKFKTPGYPVCQQRWKTCMQACGEMFGENDPRFFYSDSAVTSYTGTKCEETPQVAEQPTVRCCKVCRMSQRSNYRWIDCSDYWLCSAEVSAREYGQLVVEGSSDAQNLCAPQYELERHRMKVDVHVYKFTPANGCPEVQSSRMGAVIANQPVFRKSTPSGSDASEDRREHLTYFKTFAQV